MDGHAFLVGEAVNRLHPVDRHILPYAVFRTGWLNAREPDLTVPIFVEDEVLKSSKLANVASDRASSEELRKWLENLNDEDLGRYKM